MEIFKLNSQTDGNRIISTMHSWISDKFGNLFGMQRKLNRQEELWNSIGDVYLRALQENRAKAGDERDKYNHIVPLRLVCNFETFDTVLQFGQIISLMIHFSINPMSNCGTSNFYSQAFLNCDSYLFGVAQILDFYCKFGFNTCWLNLNETNTISVKLSSISMQKLCRIGTKMYGIPSIVV